MKLALRLAVSAVVLGLLAVFLPWAAVRDAVTRMSGTVWLAVLGLFIAGHVANAVKWRLLVNARRPTLNLLRAIRFHFAGLFANMWLPGIVGGDVLRAVLASRTSGRTEAVVLGGLADRVIDTISVVVLLGVGALTVRQALPAGAGRGITALLVVGALGGATLLAMAARRPIRRWPERLRRPIGRGLVALRALARRPGAALATLTLSLVIQGGFVLLNAWIGSTIGIGVPIGAWFMAWSLAKLAGLLPISLGGLGVRDATLAALLAPFGVPIAVGVVASLIWQSVLIVGGLFGGLVWLSLARLPGGGAQAGRLADARPVHAAGPRAAGVR